MAWAWERGADPRFRPHPHRKKRVETKGCAAAWAEEVRTQIMAATAVGESLSDSDADSAEDVIREGNRMGSSELSALTRAHA